MGYWRWNSSLSSAEIREQVALALFQDQSARAAGSSGALVPEAQRQERRRQPDRRLRTGGAWLPMQNQRARGDRRRCGAQASSASQQARR